MAEKSLVHLHCVIYCFFLYKPGQHIWATLLEAWVCDCVKVMPSVLLGEIRFQLFITGVDSFNKEEHWNSLWPRDIKISLWPCKQGLECKSATAGGNCTQHAARSSPLNKLGQNLWPHRHLSAVGFVSVSAYGTHKWWCGGVRRDARGGCFQFQGSAGILQLSIWKWIIPSLGTQTGNTMSPKSPLGHKHLYICNLIPTLSFCLSLKSNNIILKMAALL